MTDLREEKKNLEESYSKLKRFVNEYITWLIFQIVTVYEKCVKLVFSSSAMDDLQMKELQDQLEAEQYFSVSISCK